MNIELKKGTKSSDGIEISLGDLLDVRGQFTENDLAYPEPPYKEISQ
jgi:hypothetical protein